MTETGLRIRLADELRSDFIATCKARDMTAAQVLRAFMRSYVEQYGQDITQQSLVGLERPVKHHTSAEATS